MLEVNYSKMEVEYFRRIKELKTSLIERGRRQVMLNSKAGVLREECKEHQQEISRITEELAAEKERENEHKQKKSGSPGLLKTSLESGKKVEKKMSPSMQPSNRNLVNDRSQQNLKETDVSTQVLYKKGFSPPNLTKKAQLFQHKK